MMKSFSCCPLIFPVCSETVALPQPKLIFGRRRSFQQIVVVNSFAICVLAALALRLKMGAEESSVVRLYRYAEQ
jgi:hypothetical protein